MVTGPALQLSGLRVFVAGHRGMVGSAIVRRLAAEDCDILTIARRDLDLTRQDATERYLAETRPDVVIITAGRVGGIFANNSFPVQFLADNLAIAHNLITAAHATRVRKLLFLGSSCIYPKFAPQPITEDALLTGPLEPTNEWYAIAKIAGIKLALAHRRQYGDDFISLMPTNLYGPGDNYHPDHSHVPAALMRRMHEAKVAGAPAVTVWGTGTPLRDFLFVDDLADACIFAVKNYSGDDFLNVGSGKEVSIAEFARIIAGIVGYRGELIFDVTRPDGTPRKLLDSSRLLELGWRPRTDLGSGLAETYADFLASASHLRGSQVPAAVDQ
jgi:GDP-L-fucose synthase